MIFTLIIFLELSECILNGVNKAKKRVMEK